MTTKIALLRIFKRDFQKLTSEKGRWEKEVLRFGQPIQSVNSCPTFEPRLLPFYRQAAAAHRFLLSRAGHPPYLCLEIDSKKTNKLLKFKVMKARTFT
ncbi:MAG: hypothetical protein JXR71_10325, partial [Bacteroidales bacterium]|nr:hypothetical protein [Bacteroidales bacterium]